MVCMMELSMPDSAPARATFPPLAAGDAGLGAEDHEGVADANLVAELEGVVFFDAGAVDVAAVGAAHVVENPSRPLRRGGQHRRGGG
jgi:hypothetical protein